MATAHAVAHQVTERGVIYDHLESRRVSSNHSRSVAECQRRLKTDPPPAVGWGGSRAPIDTGEGIRCVRSRPSCSQPVDDQPGAAPQPRSGQRAVSAVHRAPPDRGRRHVLAAAS